MTEIQNLPLSKQRIIALWAACFVTEFIYLTVVCLLAVSEAKEGESILLALQNWQGFGPLGSPLILYLAGGAALFSLLFAGGTIYYLKKLIPSAQNTKDFIQKYFTAHAIAGAPAVMGLVLILLDGSFLMGSLFFLSTSALRLALFPGVLINVPRF